MSAPLHTDTDLSALRVTAQTGLTHSLAKPESKY